MTRHHDLTVRPWCLDLAGYRAAAGLSLGQVARIMREGFVDTPSLAHAVGPLDGRLGSDRGARELAEEIEELGGRGVPHLVLTWLIDLYAPLPRPVAEAAALDGDPEPRRQARRRLLALPTIKGLTLRQPVASAMVDDRRIKPIEHRGWKPGPWWQPERQPLWVACHAGLGDWSPAADVLPKAWPDCPPAGDWPRGKVLGLLEFVSVLRPVEVPSDWRAGLAWAEGPWCWLVGRVVRLEEPIAYTGARGLWEPSALLRCQLESVLPADYAEITRGHAVNLLPF